MHFEIILKTIHGKFWVSELRSSEKKYEIDSRPGLYSIFEMFTQKANWICELCECVCVCLCVSNILASEYNLKTMINHIDSPISNFKCSWPQHFHSFYRVNEWYLYFSLRYSTFHFPHAFTIQINPGCNIRIGILSQQKVIWRPRVNEINILFHNRKYMCEYATI